MYVYVISLCNALFLMSVIIRHKLNEEEAA